MEVPGGIGTALAEVTNAADRAREIAKSALGDQENRVSYLPRPPAESPRTPGYTTRRRRDVTSQGRQAV